MIGTNAPASDTTAGLTTAVMQTYTQAFRRLPNHGGPSIMRRKAAALAAATAQLVAKATSNCSAPMPTRTSARTCAGNTARINSHHRRYGLSSSAQNSTMLGGQNGAKILSDSVPTKNAASAPA